MLPEARLIALAQQLVEKEQGVQDPSLLADDFVFLAPIVGPLSKAKFLEAFANFNLKKAFPGERGGEGPGGSSANRSQQRWGPVCLSSCLLVWGIGEYAA